MSEVLKAIAHAQAAQARSQGYRGAEARYEPENALARAFVVPPVMLGTAPEPRSIMERGARLIAEAEAFGIDPTELCNPDVDYVIAYRLREAIRGYA